MSRVTVSLSQATGEGGAVVTNDDSLAAKLRALRNHGIELTNGKIDFTFAGFNYRMTDFQAALGYFQMLVIDAFIQERILVADGYNTRLSGVPFLKTPALIAGRKNVYQTYHVLLDSKINRDDLKKAMLEKGIETNYGANALHLLQFYREKYHLHEDDFPNSVISYRQGLALPLSHYVNEAEIITVCKQLTSLIQ